MPPFSSISAVTPTFVTRTSGRFVSTALGELGVSTDYLGIDPVMPTPVTFCELFPPDTFPLYFYRYPQAPDLRVGPEDLPQVAVTESRVFWTTLTGMSAEPSRSAHSAAWQLRGRRTHTILDLDYRPMFWTEEAEATGAAGEALDHATVAIGNLEECRVAVGETGELAGELVEVGQCRREQRDRQGAGQGVMAGAGPGWSLRDVRGVAECGHGGRG